MTQAEARELAGDAIPTWLRKLVVVMDDAIRIPGMDRGIGLDAIVGALVPGVGDALTGFVTLSLLFYAVKRGVPASVVFRMIGNQLVDVAVGTVPGLGDVFDVFFRSNRRNLELLEKHVATGAPPTLGDRVLVGVAIAVALGLALVPFVVLYFAITALVSALGGT